MSEEKWSRKVWGDWTIWHIFFLGFILGQQFFLALIALSNSISGE